MQIYGMQIGRCDCIINENRVKFLEKLIRVKKITSSSLTRVILLMKRGDININLVKVNELQVQLEAQQQKIEVVKLQPKAIEL